MEFFNKKDGAHCRKKIHKKRLRLFRWLEALEQYGQAAGLAQGGDTDAARGVLQEFLQEPRKILVVTGADGGSRDLMRCAASIARRMNYHVWHLVCGGHEEHPEAKDWRYELQDIPYRQITFAGAEDQLCVERILGELKRVQFILMEEKKFESEGVGVPVFFLMSEA